MEADKRCLTIILLATLFYAVFRCIFGHRFGRVAEWLGRGLQNLVRRFESAPDLSKALYMG